MKTWLPALAFALILAGVASADLGPRVPLRPVPTPPPPVVNGKTTSAAVPLVIDIDDKATDARIEIPVQLFRRADLDNGDKTQRRAEMPRLPTIMTGLCLALALAFSGLWVVRHRALPGRTLTVVLVAGAIAVGSAVVWANGAPLLPRTPLPPAPAVVGNGDRVVLELVNRQDGTVRMTVSKKQLEKILEDANKKAEPKK